MNIKCANCGHPNMLGAIFCRNCGEKLNIDNMRPELKETESRGGIFGAIRRIIGLLVLFTLVGVIVAMFIPAAVQSPSLSDDAKKQATDKYQELLKKVDRGYGKNSFTFKPEEITFLYNDDILGKPLSKPIYAIEEFICTVDPMGFLNFFIKTKLAGKIPITFEITGSINNESQPVGFIITEAKMGHMPIKFLENKVGEKLMPLLDDERITKLLKAAEKIGIDENHELVVTLKEGKAEKPKK